MKLLETGSAAKSNFLSEAVKGKGFHHRGRREHKENRRESSVPHVVQDEDRH
jgi:hypothetical protein